MTQTVEGLADRQPLVAEAEAVSKSFGETRALRDVSLQVTAGSCHGLVGRNGAGKSTLVSILTGLTRPDGGAVRLGGESVPSLGDRAGWQGRVACVYQKSMVVPSLTVAENVFLNRPTSANAGGLINWGQVRSQARSVMLEWGFDIDVDQLASSLSVEQRQIVEIARALSIGARFLILDEPTASLEKAAIERLFDRLRRLQSSGVGIMYISHHLEEIYEICGQVTVLRDGARVLTGAVKEISLDQLVASMVGITAAQASTEVGAASLPTSAGAVRLRVSNLVVPSAAGSVRDVSLEVAAGECVGLVGLRGSGSVTLADTVAGLLRPRAGEIELDGKPVQPGRTDVALKRGLGYVPEDRHARGLVPTLGVTENLTLAVLERLARWGVLSGQRRSVAAAAQIQNLGIVARGGDQPVGELSGGNQQKVAVGRALAQAPTVLVAVTPTVGVDVASKEALLNAIAHARDQGMAILLVSDDLEDLRICNRLLIMVRGSLVKEFRQPPWDRHELISSVEGLAAGAERGA